MLHNWRGALGEPTEEEFVVGTPDPILPHLTFRGVGSVETKMRGKGGRVL